MTPPVEFIPPSLEELAELLPAYEMKSFIAKGGMGAVYMASQRSLDRVVAIKILPRNFGEDEAFRASFEKEAKSMAKFNHSNLVSIHDFGQIDGMLYFVMEMIEGESLYAFAYGNQIVAKEANRLIVEVCDGLEHAHKFGILHRDIKPANILLNKSGSAKIGDFGLARRVEDHDSDQAFGTPGYTAPEVVNDPTAIRECTDIYSVGVMLYELLTGEMPKTPYVPVTSIIKCSPQYDQIILKATNENPLRRYQSASEMSEALTRIDNTEAGSPFAAPSSNPRVSPSSAVSKANPQVATPLAMQDSFASEDNAIKKKLMLIVVLFGVIIAGWQGRVIVEEKREAEKVRQELAEQLVKEAADAKAAAAVKEASELKEAKEIAKAKKAKEIAKAKKAKKAKEIAKAKKIVEVTETKKTTDQAVIKTFTKTLEQLKGQLSKGLRNEMPIGTVSENGRSRFYIETKMSWYEANQFAQSYGGHLSVFPSPADLDSFRSQIEEGQSIWVGAGSAGGKKWQWVDGTAWNHDVIGDGDLSFLSVTSSGSLSATSPKEENSFYIEWLDNGESPATLTAQFKRTSDSRDVFSPQYPAGTVRFNGGYYFLLRKESDWIKAADLALQSGGHLATASSEEENQWLVDFVAPKLGDGDSCWIGGLCKKFKKWEWQTGEPWLFSKWLQGGGKSVKSRRIACAIEASKSWSSCIAAQELPYMLIEWSKHEGSLADAGVKAASDEFLEAKLKCREVLQNFIKNSEAKVTGNTRRLKLELTNVQSRMSNKEKEDNELVIAKIIKSIENNRISSTVEDDMFKKLADAYKESVKKQDLIEAELRQEVGNTRVYYIKKLEGVVKSYKEGGKHLEAENVEREIRVINDQPEKFADYILKI